MPFSDTSISCDDISACFFSGCIFSEEDRYMAAKRKKKARQAAAQTTAP